MPGLESLNLNWQNFSFAHPGVLWLLAALPVLILLLARAEILSRRAVKSLVAQRLLPLLSMQVNWGARRLIGALRVLGLAALILALAGPRMGYREIERESRGLDIIFLVDTSRSMLAQDIKPDRLTRTRLAALDLATALKGDRLALVAFAGGGFLQVPLTVDYVAMRESIQALDTEIIPTQGTNFGDALRLAIDAFGNSDKHSRAIVIFSDGEDWGNEAEDEVKTLTEQGVPVFTVGVGTPQGGPIPVPDRSGRLSYHRDSAGNVVQTHLVESGMQDIAKRTGGEYLRLEETPRLAEVLQNSLKRVDSDTASVTSREPLEQYQWPLGLGILLLVLAQLLGDRRDRPGLLARGGARRNETVTEPPVPVSGIGSPVRASQRARAVVVGLGLALGVGLVSPSDALAKSMGEQAVELQKFGKDKEAFDLYQKELQKRPDSPLAGQLNFNAGVAAFKAGKTDEAIRGFSQSLLSDDPSLQEQSHYNLGKSLFKKGADARQSSPDQTIKDWEKAIEQYENTLKLNAQNAKAQANLEYAKKQLEELKKQQPQDQQQKQDQKQDQKNDQKQDKQDQNKQDQQKGGQQNQDQQKQDQQGEKKDDPNQQGGAGSQEKEQNSEKQQGDQKGEKGESGKGQQAQNDSQKQGEEGKQDKEDAQAKTGEQKDQRQQGDKSKPDSGQGKLADNQQQNSNDQKGEEQAKQPSIDDSAKADQKAGAQDAKGQPSQDFQASSNKPEGEQSNAEEGKAVTGAPMAMTRQEAASLLESMDDDEAKGTILESRSARRPPGKDW